MKSSRFKTSRQVCNNRSRSSSRRSKQSNSMTIDLNVAKHIVKKACIDAMCAAGIDTKENFCSPSVTDESDNDIVHRNSSAEIEFTEFISSTISQAIASIGSQMKPQSIGKLTQKSATKRSRKRPRSVESKVKGLEYADSLYTMCSLFPVMLASVETPLLQDTNNKDGISDNITESVDSPRCNEELSSTIGYPSSPKSKNTCNDHHSDHDSLLPPVGAASTTTTPTRLLRTEEEGTSVEKAEISVTEGIPSSPPKQQQQQQQQCPRTTKAMKRSLINGNEDRTFSQMLSSDSQPSDPLSHGQHSEKTDANNNIHDHDDDCNYDRPLIGVFGDDEGSGLVSHNISYNNYYGLSNGAGGDAVIQLAKVGSVILQKSLSVDMANR